MPTFKDWVTQTLAPVWLRGRWGAKYLGVLGEAADRIATATKDAVKVQFPETCPVDALPYNGAARNIERYTADTDDSYRTRITDPWSVWEFAGSTTSLLDRLHDQGYANVQIYGWYQLQPSVEERFKDWWSAFWVWISPPHDIGTDGTWGDPGTWDDTVAGPPPGPGAWDLDITADRVAELRASIRKWKAAHELCAEFKILISGDRWENVAPWDNGTWSDEQASVVIGG